MQHSFFVPGIPVPKGSAKAFMRPGAKFPTVMQDNRDKQKPWASLIAYTAQAVGVQYIDKGPVAISVIFRFPHLKSHYGTGRNSCTLKPGAPEYHTAKPDLDKLLRCVKDALTGVAWKDDSQVAEVIDLRKIYSEQPGAFITIEALK